MSRTLGTDSHGANLNRRATISLGIRAKIPDRS
jgi:hypothetical protein